MSARTRRPGGGPRPSAAGRTRSLQHDEVLAEAADVPVLPPGPALQPSQLQNREVEAETVEPTPVDEAPAEEPAGAPAVEPIAEAEYVEPVEVAEVAVDLPHVAEETLAGDLELELLSSDDLTHVDVDVEAADDELAHDEPADDAEVEENDDRATSARRRTAAKGPRVLHAARTAAHTAATRPMKAAATWNADMLEKAETGPRCGTRWGRGAVTLVPSVALTVGIGGAIAQGVLAASLNLTNQPFTLYSNKIAGTGMGLYLNSANTSGGATASARVGIASATLDGFCGLVKQPMSLAGINKDVYMIITAGQSVTGTPNTTPTRLINASNLFMQASSLTSGSDVNNPATIQNAILGISADNIQMPTGAGGAAVTMPTSSGYGSGATPGGFGLQGSGLDANGNVVPGTITIPGLKASAVDAEIAGNLALPNLNINIAVQNSGSTPPACPSTGY